MKSLSEQVLVGIKNKPNQILKQNNDSVCESLKSTDPSKAQFEIIKLLKLNDDQSDLLSSCLSDYYMLIKKDFLKQLDNRLDNLRNSF